MPRQVDVCRRSEIIDTIHDPVAPVPTRPGQVVRRLARNAGLVLGGNGFAGVVSLGYIAISARVLGPHLFGVFSLILSLASGLAALMVFDTASAVIRYGSTHIASGRRDRLPVLLGGLAALDIATAMVGATIAAATAWAVAPWLGWTPGERQAAMLFSAVLMLTTGGTSSGMLRLFGRFDLMTLADQVGPLVRLVGSIVLWWMGGRLDGFLIVWALALAGEAAAGWWAALAIRRSALALPRPVRVIARDNPGLLAFLLHNNLAGAFAPVWQYGGVLMVGRYAGASAAGGLRLAGKLTAALGKPVEAVTRALYPELAHLVADGDRATLMRVLLRIALAAAAAAVGVVVAAMLFGNTLLRLLYGPGYLYAAPVLRLLAVAAAIELAGAAVKPLLNACGASGRMLTAQAAAAIVFAALLVLLVPDGGAIGAAWAAIASMATLRAVGIGYAVRLLRRPGG